MASQTSEKQNLQYFQPDRLTGMLISWRYIKALHVALQKLDSLTVR